MDLEGRDGTGRELALQAALVVLAVALAVLAWAPLVDLVMLGG